MLFPIALLASASFIQAYPQQNRQLAQRQQYSPYDLGILEPQVPAYNFIGDKQAFPGVQPQIIFYGGAAPGQPFLLQPGSPPGNFLVPQGPNVIYRDSPAAPARPVFVAGYPKPAHIPPIEKDAEEVPTNPSKIPPLKPKGEKKPEKLETFNEDDDKVATEAEVLAEADRKSPAPAYPKTNLQPGQSFFILNGQPLFSNYPYGNQIYHQGFGPNYAPSTFFRNGAATYPDNLVFLRSNFPESKPELREEQDDSVVVDVVDGVQNDEPAAYIEEDREVVSAAKQPSEPTISQAQPGAIALAGPGGVAAAAPRGTAFVGKDGLAVSSPQATAVAGPSRDEVVEEGEEEDKDKKKKQTKKP